MNDPALAEMARVAAGLTQGALAKQLGKTQAFVSQVERGERDIPSDLLDSWALACQVPSSFFGRRDVPLADSIAGIVHRRRKTLPTKPFNRATAQVKMGCLEVDTLLSEVDVVPALSLPYFPRGTGPADAADALRRAWGVPAGPLPNLTALIESTGTPVLLLDSLHEKHSATSQRGRWFDWLIALNGNHPASRRRFTLAHEVGHIVLRHDAEMLLIVDDGLVGQLEAEADAFAAELLMPATEARRELRAADFRRLVALKQRWQVSVAFLIRQALDLGLIDRNRRQQLEILLSSQPGGRRREPGEFEGEEPKLVRQVIDALRQDGLSLADIAKMATTTESTLRTRYLGERPPLRVVDDHHSRRTVLELRRP